MTGRWLTLHAAARQLGVTIPDVMQLGAEGHLRVEYLHDHHSVSEESVTAYLKRPAVPVGEGPDIGFAANQEYRDSQADYDDTPNDEGDDA